MPHPVMGRSRDVSVTLKRIIKTSGQRQVYGMAATIKLDIRDHHNSMVDHDFEVVVVQSLEFPSQ